MEFHNLEIQKRKQDNLDTISQKLTLLNTNKKELKSIIKNNFGTEKGKKAFSFVKEIDLILSDKENLNFEQADQINKNIEKFIYGNINGFGSNA